MQPLRDSFCCFVEFSIFLMLAVVGEDKVVLVNNLCNSKSGTVMDTVLNFQPYEFFDIIVMTEKEETLNCSLRREIVENFQIVFSSFGRFNNETLIETTSRKTLILGFMTELGQQNNILDGVNLQPFEFWVMRQNWRKLGYPSCFIVVQANVFNGRDATMELSVWAQKVTVDSEVFVWVVSEEGNVAQLFEIYVVKGLIVVRDLLELVQTRNRNTFLILLHTIARRSNFLHAPVVGVNVDHPDYEAATKFKHTPNSSLVEFDGGYEVFIYWYTRDALNFTEVAMTWDNYIRQGPNGTIIGLGLPVNRRLADVAISAGEFLLWRVSGPDALTYLQPMFYNSLIAVFKQPPASSIRNIFLQTFSTSLWLVLFGVWFALCVALVATIRIAQKLNPFLRYSLDEQLQKDSWLWAISTICQQGWHMTPYSGPTRTVFISGFFTAVVTYVAYSAALVAILSVQVVPITAFKDLFTYKFNILSDNHIPTAKFIVQTLETEKLITTLANEGRNVEVAEKISDLTRRRTAIVTQSDSFYPVLAKRGVTELFACSSLSAVSYSSRPVLSGFTVKRGSPLRTFFNNKIIQMRERGVMPLLRKRYLDLTTFRCSNEGSNIREPIGIRDVLTAYIILSLGFSIAITGFIVEKLWHRREDTQVTQWAVNRIIANRPIS